MKYQIISSIIKTPFQCIIIYKIHYKQDN